MKLEELRNAVETGGALWVERLLDPGNVRTPTMFGGDTAAWGQYLQHPLFPSQHGIYATAAALQVLHDAGQQIWAQRAFRYLSMAIDPAAPAPQPRVARSRNLVMKHSAIAFTLGKAAGFEEHDRTRRLATSFLERSQHDTGAWGFYCTADGRLGEPHVIPTTHVLLAYKAAAGAQPPRLPQALAWLEDRLRNLASLRPAELSLILHVLAAYERSDSKTFQRPFDEHLVRLRREHELWFNYMFDYPVEHVSGEAEPRYHVINAQVCHLNLLRQMGLSHLFEPPFYERVWRLADTLKAKGALTDPFSGRIETRTVCLTYLTLANITEAVTTVGIEAASATLTQAYAAAAARQRAESRQLKRFTGLIALGVFLILGTAGLLYHLGVPSIPGYLVSSLLAIAVERFLIFIYRIGRRGPSPNVDG